MAMKLILAYGGILLLGIVLFLIGWIIEPARTFPPAAPAISESGESLIAIGLTFIIAGIGFFLAYANPTQ